MVPATAASPIVIDSYGTGNARPRIDAAGYQSQLNGYSQSTVNDATYYPNFKYGSGAVTLFNQQYWEINNLELTNTVAGTFDPTNKANNFSGVRVWARNAGTLNHIYVRSNYIHDVTGEVSFSGDRAEGKRTGGIVVYTWDYNSDSAQTRFNDLRIENNFISNVSMEGICLQQASKTNISFVNRTGYNDGSPWIPYTNLLVDGNLVNNFNDANSSDAIQLTGAQYANVYNNLVIGGGYRRDRSRLRRPGHHRPQRSRRRHPALRQRRRAGPRRNRWRRPILEPRHRAQLHARQRRRHYPRRLWLRL